jgi:hypothetical protein
MRFMEQRLQIPRSHSFFIDASSARPDLAIKPKKNRPLPAALRGRPLLGIEARSRKGADMKYDLHATDRDDLERKLKGSGCQKLIAIYHALSYRRRNCITCFQQ